MLPLIGKLRFGEKLIRTHVYNRIRLSKGLPTDASKLEWRNASDLKIKYNTNLRIGVVSAYTSV